MRSRLLSLAAVALVLAAVFGYGYVRFARPFEQVVTLLERAREVIERARLRTGSYPPGAGPARLKTPGDETLWPLSGTLPDDPALAGFPEAALHTLLYASNGRDFIVAAPVDESLLRMAELAAPGRVLSLPRRLLGYRTSGQSVQPQDFERRIKDRLANLEKLIAALALYRERHGAYPASPDFSGPVSRYGPPSLDYIPGLAPECISALPVTKKSIDDGADYDFLYKSDTSQYALMIFDHEFCMAARDFGSPLADRDPACRYAGSVPAGEDFLPRDFTARRLFDLDMLAAALARYRADKGAYPRGHGFCGLFSLYGDCGPDWIPGLAPEYVDFLPRDPRLNADPANQYLYASDGVDYKLIAHHPEDGPAVKRDRAELIDPLRGEGAYGYWTPGAANW